MTQSITSPHLETSECHLTSSRELQPAVSLVDLDSNKGLGQRAHEHQRRRGQVADRLLNRARRSAGGADELAAKMQQNVAIESPASPSLSDNASLLQDKIKEIRELADKLTLDAASEQSRELLYCIYTRAAEAIGRNSVDAIKADTISHLENLLKSSAIPAFYGRSGDTPEKYVQREILPKLHPDMRQFAFEQSIFRDSMRKFYSTITTWRFDKRPGVEKFKFSKR